MQVHGILETAIHVSDVAASVRFYQDLFGFETLDLTDQFCAFNVAGRGVLLVFQKGTTQAAKILAGGLIPPHDGDSPTHFAFSITAEDLPAWEQRLAAAGIAIEGRMTWSRGGRSLYFRDPDQNLLELATPGVWTIY
jgi:catechol 2,3-dioxygenase-like lactoylglutathione lyase family enzyme